MWTLTSLRVARACRKLGRVAPGGKRRPDTTEGGMPRHPTLCGAGTGYSLPIDLSIESRTPSTCASTLSGAIFLTKSAAASSTLSLTPSA